MKSTKRGQKASTKKQIVKHQNTKRVAIALLLALIGTVVYYQAYQYTHQAKLERQFNQVRQEVEAKDKSLLQSSKERQELEKKLKELEAQLQAKRAEQARVAALTQQRASAARVPVSGTCAEWIAAAGISDVASAAELIRRESGCNPNAINRSSGACGVAQELPCGKSGCALGDGACQVRWMNGYVSARYGSWANAVAFHDRNNWY